MEGIAYGTHQILETLAVLGHAPRQIYTCGGHARSQLFMQIYADVCGVPISLTQVSEAPLLGGAILAAAGLGLYPDIPSAAQAMVKLTRTFVPDAERYAIYRFYFEQYQQTYAQLRDLMHTVSGHESSRTRGGP